MASGMRVRSKEELVDRLSEMSQPRKRELITLDQFVKHGREHEREIARRSAIVFSYAHWEGFVKDAAIAYVEYVAFRSPLFGTLTANFQAIVCRTYLTIASQATRRITPHLNVVHQFTNYHMSNVRIDSKAAIDTESNLNAEVFENICQTLGIDYSAHWSKYGHFIDDLVEQRCAIAHGELLRPQENYVQEVLDFVLQAISWFTTDVENAVLMNAYLRQP